MCLLGNPKVGTTNNQLTIQLIIAYLAWTRCFFSCPCCLCSLNRLNQVDVGHERTSSFEQAG